MNSSQYGILTALALTVLAPKTFAYEVTVGTFVVNPGSSVTVPVAIDNAKGLAYAGVRLAYDPQILVPVKVSEGTLRDVFTSDFVSTGDLSEGWVTASVFAHETIATNLAGTIANVTFLVREGTEGLYSDIAVSKVEVGDAGAVKDVTLDNPVTAVNGMVRVMSGSAAVARLENAQTIGADTEIGSLSLAAGDAIQASGAQTPIVVSGVVESATGKVPVKAPIEGWTSGRYELLKTPTAGLSFTLEGIDAQVVSETRDGFIVYAIDAVVVGEVPVLCESETLTGEDQQRIRDLVAMKLATDYSRIVVKTALPDVSPALVAYLGVAPACSVDELGVVTATFAMPKLIITSFDPDTGDVVLKVVPGEGNSIVRELATGCIRVYGSSSLSEQMSLVSQVRFDLSKYLTESTKGEVLLTVELGNHKFLRVKADSVLQ